MIVSDAPNCGVTYDHHNYDRSSFIIQATGCFFQMCKSTLNKHLSQIALWHWLFGTICFDLVIFFTINENKQ
jgi:hypothetical protein